MDKLRAARKAEQAQKAKRLAAEGAAAQPADEAEPEPVATFVDRMFCARSPCLTPSPALARLAAGPHVSTGSS